LPISLFIDGICVGYIIVGHRRIKEDHDRSKINLERQLHESRKSRFEKINFLELYEKVELISMMDLVNFPNSEYFSKLKTSIIIEIVVAKRLADIESNLLTSAAKITHLISQPLQSLIAISDNLYTETMDAELKGMALRLRDELIKLSFHTCPLNNLNYMEVTPRYQFKKVDIIDLLMDTIILFREQAKIDKDVEIYDPIIRLTPPIDIIEASEPHVKQIIYNIMHNAVKYSFSSTDRANRYIQIVCKSYRNYFIIEFINFGIGILENEIRDGLIYKDGYRGELTKDRSRIGSGIGLGVVRKYIEDHSGKIEIESEKLGEGIKVDPYKTTVRIYLPFTQRRY
jgi:signal transduction histidine kinase